jgi:hypothetical protein
VGALLSQSTESLGSSEHSPSEVPVSEFTKSLVVSPLADGRTWVLMEPFSYDVGAEGSGDTVQVPVLFMTDFASVPRPFWSFFPPWGKYGNAAVIHDFGYATQTRKKWRVDAIFIEGMKVLGVDVFTRWTLFLAVSVFGWFAWWADGRRKRRGVSITADRLPDKSIERPQDVRQSAAG